MRSLEVRTSKAVYRLFPMGSNCRLAYFLEILRTRCLFSDCIAIAVPKKICSRQGRPPFSVRQP